MEEVILRHYYGRRREQTLDEGILPSRTPQLHGFLPQKSARADAHAPPRMHVTYVFLCFFSNAYSFFFKKKGAGTAAPSIMTYDVTYIGDMKLPEDYSPGVYTVTPLPSRCNLYK